VVDRQEMVMDGQLNNIEGIATSQKLLAGKEARVKTRLLMMYKILKF
jgi:hypothetical protein